MTRQEFDKLANLLKVEWNITHWYFNEREDSEEYGYNFELSLGVDADEVESMLETIESYGGYVEFDYDDVPVRINFKSIDDVPAKLIDTIYNWSRFSEADFIDGKDMRQYW